MIQRRTAPADSALRPGRRSLVVALAIAGGLVVLALFVRWGFFVHREALEPGTNDFGLFWLSGRALLEGRDVYATEDFGYPYLPTFYLLIAPFAALPLASAVIAWHAFKCVVLVAIVVATWRMMRRLDVRPGVAAGAIAVAFAGIGRALDSDMRLGQCNLLVLGLVVGAIWACFTYRDEVAGCFAGIAALAKVTPGLFLLYFAWKRRWRIVGASAAALLLFGVAAPLAVYGPAETVRLHREFAERLIVPSLESGAPRSDDGYVPGQSLAPIAFRLLTKSQAVARERADRAISIHVAELDADTVNLIVKVAVVLLLIVLLAAARPQRFEERRTRRTLLEFGMVAAVMLLASPYARKAQFVHLFPLFVPIALAALERRRPATIALLAVAILAPFLTARGLVGRELSMAMSAFGPFTVAALALLVAALLEGRALRRSERRAEQRAPPPDLELSVFFPARNEEANIGGVVAQALEILPAVTRRHEVIVVDDGSRDGTAAVVEQLTRAHPDRVRLVRHETARGYGGAVRSGLASARYRHVFFTDGDGQFDLRELPHFLAPLSHRDAVIGFRQRRRDPPHRKLFAYCWGALVRTLFGIASRDIDCAYKVVPSAAARAARLEADGAFVSTELLAKLDRLGCRWVERPVHHFERRHGRATGADPLVILKAFRELVRFRRKIARFDPDAARAAPAAASLERPAYASSS